MITIDGRDWFPIPGIKDSYLACREGLIYNRNRNRLSKLRHNHKGYLVASVMADDGTVAPKPVHRLVALAFVDRPKRHQAIPHEDLQVNHKDGNKENNQSTNLEWVTNAENMQHAREAGLFSNEHPVMARHCATGQIQHFRSVSAAARHVGITNSLLLKHLGSEAAGRVQADGWVYKQDDGSEWPTVVFPEVGHLALNRVADVIVTKEGEKRIWVFNSTAEAARLLDLNLIALKNHFARRGVKEPFDGYLFHAIGDYFKKNSS